MNSNYPENGSVWAANTVDLSLPEYQSERDNLESSYQAVLGWIKSTKDVDLQIVASDTDIFNCLVGLIPETTLFGNDKAGVLLRLLENEPFNRTFHMLKLSSHKDAYSLFHIGELRKCIEKYREAVPQFQKIDMSEDNQLIADLMENFEKSSPADREILYGLFSGFPLSATIEWAKGAGKNSVYFAYEPIELNKLADQSIKNLNPPYPPHLLTMMPNIAFVPNQRNKHLPPYVAQGLPGTGFRFAEQTGGEEELKVLYARFNFIYLTLGAAQDIPQLHAQAKDAWLKRQAQQKEEWKKQHGRQAAFLTFARKVRSLLNVTQKKT